MSRQSSDSQAPQTIIDPWHLEAISLNTTEGLLRDQLKRANARLARLQKDRRRRTAAGILGHLAGAEILANEGSYISLFNDEERTFTVRTALDLADALERAIEEDDEREL